MFRGPIFPCNKESYGGPRGVISNNPNQSPIYEAIEKGVILGELHGAPGILGNFHLDNSPSYGGFAKTVVPNNHGVFLLKMIITWGVKWGFSHHLRNHPYIDLKICAHISFCLGGRHVDWNLRLTAHDRDGTPSMWNWTKKTSDLNEHRIICLFAYMVRNITTSTKASNGGWQQQLRSYCDRSPKNTSTVTDFHLPDQHPGKLL